MKTRTEKKRPPARPPRAEYVDIGKRIAQAREEAGLSQDELGELCGVTGAAVGQWEAGITTPKGFRLRNLAQGVGRFQNWILSGEGPSGRRDSHSGGAFQPTLTPVPLLLYEQVREMKKASRTEIGPGAVTEYASEPISNAGFALRVQGDSMAPDLPEGVVVFVDPRVEPLNGSFVLALLDERSDPTIKEYVVDGPFRYLKPRNPRYETVRVDEGVQILGVVVEMRKAFPHAKGRPNR